MPRNRRDVDREQKIREILDVAVEQVQEGGYAALSAGAIAEQVGIARGAVYWYFPSKDHLFAAASAAAIQRAVAQPPRELDSVELIVWAVNRLSRLRHVHTGLQERARMSEAAAEVGRVLQVDMRRRLREALAELVPEDRLDVATETTFIFVQGVLSMPLDKKRRETAMRFLLDQLRLHPQ